MAKSVSYNDGKTAARRKVLAEISGDDLVLSNQAFREVARWPLADIRYVDPSHRRPPLRLRLAESDARITLDGGDDGGWLTHKCPNLTKRGHGAVRWPTWVAAGILAVVSIAGIFVFLLPAASSAIVQLVPPALEQSIGREARNQLLSLIGKARKGAGHVECTNPRAIGILKKRADELATLMETPFPVRVSVVRLPIANALALPGGEIVILSGLIDKAESGDEVIGVLAHEIAHVTRRDPLQVSIKQTGAALMVSLIVGDVFGGAALGGVASSLIESGYSRDAEAAADFIAVTALNQLGLTARPLADFLERIERETPLADIMPSFLNTHPSSGDRSRDIRDLSQGVGRAMSGYEWENLRKICD
ncbi:MAG: M48 family metallopeptidase [Rhodospirillales bacterium]|nr:M48 family metallopeptidase [Rhodospirillales bacterium]MBO6787208.1 M48 family metallopeptidase [Rhodospirillales bacterium]